MNLFLLVIVAATTFNNVHCQNEPLIVRSVRTNVQKAGKTGFLPCFVTNLLDNTVQWIQQSTNKIISTNTKIEIDDKFNPLIDGYRKYEVILTVTPNYQLYKLYVRRLQLRDAGVYVCRINIRGQSTQPSKSGKLVVLLPPSILNSITTQTVNVDTGMSANLTCGATGYPKPNITWVRPSGKNLPPPYNRYSYKADNLHLTNIQAMDRGVYRCLADNNVRPPATYDATVYVQFTPRARPVQSTYGQAQNRQFNLIIECLISGYPEPELKWYKQIADGRREITDSDFFKLYRLLGHSAELDVSEYWFQLEIINVQANDYGNYICEGSNRLGKGTAKVFVFETSECQGPLCPAEHTFIGRGHSLTASITVLLGLLAIWWIM